ncbi:MAG: hypothetical protein M1823_000160 [Watsoniomyces obsoletus]|nr:MAG: hypothetical protein M1823_000160 [Watsoniomyces obsoletus]
MSELLDVPSQPAAQFRGPVTALAFAELERQRVILSGEGPVLKVISDDGGKILAQVVVFKTQVIHGIIASGAAAKDKFQLVVWGGYTFRCCWLQSSDWTISFDREQTWTLPGWILDVSFGPPEDPDIKGDEEVRVALVTAQDVLRLVPFPPPAGWSLHDGDVGRTTTSSVLYSAHIRWMSSNYILLATGTAFGDIGVRSFRLNTGDLGGTLCTHRVFRGHEGSIFGVQTSEPLPRLGWNGPTRLLASCSDDRTIRVWDISEFSTTEAIPSQQSKPAPGSSTGTGFGGHQNSDPDGNSPEPLAMALGHLSRIWGTRFVADFRTFGSETPGIDLLSFGEDATVQHWRFSREPKDPTSLSSRHNVARFALERLQTISLHAGKNVWSIACAEVHERRLTVAIGGADGKIARMSLGEEEPVVALDVYMNSEMLARSGSLQKYSLVSHNQLLAVKEGSIRLASLSPSNKTSQATSEWSNSSSQELEWKEVAQIHCSKSYSLIRLCREAGVSVIVTGDCPIYSIYYLVLETESLLLLGYVPRRPTNILCQKSSSKKRSESYLTEANNELGFIHVIVSDEKGPILCYWRLRIRTSQNGRSIEPEPVRWIESPANFLPTSMAMGVDEDILILGARDGYVRACKLVQDWGSYEDDPIKLHMVIWSGSDDAVTSITCLSTDQREEACLILTTTRDGKYAVYRICYKSPTPEDPVFKSLTLHASTPTVLSIIEGAYFVNRQLILYGFRNIDFVVWNETDQQMIMKVDCGGAHRTWDYCPLPDSANGGSLIWRKGPRVYRRTQSHVNHQIIQEGLHGREIKAVAVSPPLEMEPGRREQLIATGAEDTSIRLLTARASSALNSKDHGPVFMCHATLKKHTTGIQALRWSPCGRYLFSSGGYEEFFIWRVRPIPGFGIGVVQEAVCPVLEEMPVVRITSFDVSPVFDVESAGSLPSNTPSAGSYLISLSRSDSSIRSFVYNCSRRTFDLIHVGIYTSCCLTQMSHLELDDHLLLCVGASDGYLALWDYEPCLKTRRISIRNDQLVANPSKLATEPDQATWCHRMKVHQSAIMALESLRIDRRSMLIATGGDDNSIGLTRISYDHNSTQPISCSTLRVIRAHACAITGIKHIRYDESFEDSGRYHIASAGIDQRVKTWEITIPRNDNNMANTQVRRIQNVHCAVADVSDMDKMEDDGEGGERLIIVGVGIELQSLKG